MGLHCAEITAQTRRGDPCGRPFPRTASSLRATARVAPTGRAVQPGHSARFDLTIPQSAPPTAPFAQGGLSRKPRGGIGAVQTRWCSLAAGWGHPALRRVRRCGVGGCGTRPIPPLCKGRWLAGTARRRGWRDEAPVFRWRTTYLSAPTPQSASLTAPLAQGSYSEGARRNWRAENVMAQS